MSIIIDSLGAGSPGGVRLGFCYGDAQSFGGPVPRRAAAG